VTLRSPALGDPPLGECQPLNALTASNELHDDAVRT
jgi:hypothetical protein